MPTTTQIADYLFKKSLGKSFTSTAEQTAIGKDSYFFSEPYDGRPAIHSHTQIWTESELIPSTAPSMTSDGDVQGVIEYVKNYQLQKVEGTTSAFYGQRLVDVIPFNFGDGSYNYSLTDSNGGAIPFGTQDWILDPDVGVLVFSESLGSLSSLSTNPPRITCYRYVGSKGVSSSGAVKKYDTLEGDGASDTFDLANAKKTSGSFEVFVGGAIQIQGQNYYIKDNSSNQLLTYNQDGTIQENSSANRDDTPYKITFVEPPLQYSKIDVYYFQEN
tara:strand:+ start:680 stop:1498 length:819 start_codon:yes stop_codon:yes gene_type:complete